MCRRTSLEFSVHLRVHTPAWSQLEQRKSEVKRGEIKELSVLFLNVSAHALGSLSCFSVRTQTFLDCPPTLSLFWIPFLSQPPFLSSFLMLLFPISSPLPHPTILQWHIKTGEWVRICSNRNTLALYVLELEWVLVDHIFLGNCEFEFFKH